MIRTAGQQLAERIKSDMRQVLKRAPVAVARLAINFMEDNFEKGGFQKSQNVVETWAPRKNSDGSGRGVLIGKQSGRLQKSGTVFQADESKVVVGVPDNIAVYGKIHNTGGKIPITDKMRKFAWFKYIESDKKDQHWKWLALTKKKFIVMPRRQFLGNSSELNRRLGAYYREAFRTQMKGTLTIK
jgi:phage gpG-like protein